MKNEKLSKLQTLPDFLIETNIINFLTMPDLFFHLRPLCSDLYNNCKNIYNLNFPEEMLSRLKSICNLNQNEDLTKQFNDRANKLLSDKNVIFIYSIQLNFPNLVNRILESSTDDRIIDLLKLFYLVLNMNDKVHLLMEKKIDELKTYNDTEESVREIRLKIEDLVDIDKIDYQINMYISYFRQLDEEFIKSVNDFSSCIYIYLGKLIEFNIEKISHKQLKDKLDIFFEKIKKTSELWPIQKKFYESTLVFIDQTRAITGITKKVYYLFDKYEIESPMNDYHIEKNNIGLYEYDPILCYNKLIENRNILKDKVQRLEKMAMFYYQCLNRSTNQSDIKDEDILIDIDGEQILLIDFLFILSLIKPQYEINIDSFKLTRKLIKRFLLN